MDKLTILDDDVVIFRYAKTFSPDEIEQLADTLNEQMGAKYPHIMIIPDNIMVEVHKRERLKEQLQTIMDGL